MPRRVLVTRPEPGASRTAECLAGLGFSPLVLPLTKTARLDIGASVPEDAAAVAVTSANAVRNAPRHLLDRLAGLPCFAVGTKTAQAAQDAGFAFVLEGPGDAEGLAQAIIDRTIGGTLVYLCGRLRRRDFEGTLAAAGIPVATAETYDTVILDSSAAAVALQGRKIDVALVYSVVAAEALLAVAKRSGTADFFMETAFCCLSGRIAQALSALPGANIRIAPEPTEAALLSLIDAAD